ncbi:MAG: acetylglutamate kinase [Bacillota bacterium]|jgi:acetylglutamate kinase|nr:acetylglutamate kinase [Bacillota bacterium]NLU55284.1 acetylglutamate kinase [Bacillota bacterium]HOA91478.1 acetylglutamate kinase [Bacillota bacterium]HOJ47020.1 acetylglutamate kinase [Bacillota bacterium]HOP54770.1 acetylglutamate kinase [Bacillota bacterium]
MTNEHDFNKVNLLVEALPYIKALTGKTVVVKYGGHSMETPEVKKAVILDLILLKYVGMNPVVVHGGGPEINSYMEKLGIEPQYHKGLRITSKEVMEIVQMVLIGKVSQELTSMINHYGGKAISISGKDGNTIIARKKLVEGVDLGYVGEVDKVNPELIESVIAAGYIPVISPVGVGLDGESYNINADSVAGEVAAALKAEKLIFLTDVEGIYEDPQNPSSIFTALQAQRARRLIESGAISKGMIPKVEACIKALEFGVNRTHIIDGRQPHTMLLEIFTDAGIGTMVVN